MASAAKQSILRLYKSLLREAQKFESYNFRNYAVRRIRDGFRESTALTESNAVSSAVSKAHRNLDIIKRQVVISKMYSADKLVIENYVTTNKHHVAI